MILKVSVRRCRRSKDGRVLQLLRSGFQFFKRSVNEQLVLDDWAAGLPAVLRLVKRRVRKSEGIVEPGIRIPFVVEIIQKALPVPGVCTFRRNNGDSR